MENPAVTASVVGSVKQILKESRSFSGVPVDKAADWLSLVLTPYFENVYRAGVEAQLSTADRRPEDPQGGSIPATPDKTVRMEASSKVNHPAHYGGDTVYEAIKVIRAWGLNFSLGSAVKYICRAGKKENEPRLDDLRKASWYLAEEIKHRSREPQKSDNPHEFPKPGESQ